uniref:DNA polymerase 2 n=1 Tax=Tricholoma terreum TaxID=76328 RepID=A0A6C0W7A9_9AGAR|nr:DNA polymerase 2 [Tricholoma terreum]QIC20231.1 DNA polymerase 2 [Tricholoma terreum]
MINNTKLIKNLIVKLCLSLQLLFNNKTSYLIFFILISTIVFLYSCVKFNNTLYIQSIGSEFSIYCGLSQTHPFINAMKKAQKIKKSYIVNWSNKVYPFDNLIFTTDLLKKYINKFWKDNIDQLDKNSHILLLTRLKRENGQIVTIGNLQRINVDDKDYLIELLLNIIEKKTDRYTDGVFKAIIFSYGVRSGLTPKTIDTEVKYQNYYHFKFPITMDPLKYGKLLFKTDKIYFVQMINKNIAIIDMGDKINKVRLFKEGDLIYEWIDKYIDESTFIREIGKNKFTFANEDLKLLTVDKTNNFNYVKNKSN